MKNLHNFQIFRRLHWLSIGSYNNTNFVNRVVVYNKYNVNLKILTCGTPKFINFGFLDILPNKKRNIS